MSFVVVLIDLLNNKSKSFTRAKEAFRLWDERRQLEGLGNWDVLLFDGMRPSSRNILPYLCA